MGFDIGAAALFGGDLFGAGAAAADVGVGAAAADVGAGVGADVLGAGAGDALAGGLTGVGLDTAGFGALGAAGGETTAALGSAAAAGEGVGLGTAGLGALDVAGGTTAADLTGLGPIGAFQGAESFVPGAEAALGAAGDVGDLGGPAVFSPAQGGAGMIPGLPQPDVPPPAFGGGPAAPTVGATQVADVTTQGLNTELTDNPVTPDTPPDTGPPEGVTPAAKFAPGGTTPGLGGGTAPPPAAGGGGAGVSGGGGGGGGAGGGGGFDWWKAAGLGLAAAPLGLTLARGEPSLPPQSGAAQGLYGAEGAAGQQLLQSAISNTPMPGQQAVLDANKQAMINAARQQLYNQGIQNPEASSAWPGMMANIQNQILQQQQQFITANLNAALSATGGAAQGLTGLAGQQIALDTAYQNAIAGAGRSLGGFVGQAGMRYL